MDGIFINNDTEPIEFDGSLAMVLNSPVFSEQISYSLQATAKYTIKNAAKFGYINKPEVADNKTKELPCKLVAGSFVLEGTIVFLYQANAFNFYFKQSGDFWSAIKDKFLKDVEWDKINIGPYTGYADIIDLVNQYQESFGYDFTFPVIVNKTVTEKFTIKLLSNDDLINNPVNSAKLSPIIPFFYLHVIFEGIFKKNGLNINKSAFTNAFLRKLCLPNNYLINEFELDKTVIWSGYSAICSITNEQNPVVTTIDPHGMDNYSFVKIGLIIGMHIDSNIYQIEKVTETVTNADGSITETESDVSFKLLNADFSAYPGYTRNYYRAINAFTEKGEDGMGRYVRLVPDKHIEEFDYPDPNHFMFYIRTDDWNFKPGYWRADVNGVLYVYPEHQDSKPIDTNYDDHNYHNAVIVPYWDIPGHRFEALFQILSPLKHTFKEINPANHVPNVTIQDFLTQAKWLLGLIPFIRASGVDIKTFKEIISASDFIDVSKFSQIITDIANPDLNGFLLQMTGDDMDTYYKSKLPVQSIDAKFSIQDPVDVKENLPAGETNDVRLANYQQMILGTPEVHNIEIKRIANNTYFIYNKSILTDSSWKLLCYNLIDMINGNSDLKIQTKFSPLMPYSEDSVYTTFNNPHFLIFAEGYGLESFSLYLQSDVNCRCKTFDNDVNPGLRLIIYHGPENVSAAHANKPIGTRIVRSSNDIYDMLNNAIPGAEFALRWDGDHGLYEKVWKEYIDWQLNNRKDCITVIQWPVQHLVDFDFSKKYRIRGIDYLVKNIKFNLDFKNQRITFNETELAKV
jgi:hypothetical protein